MVAHKLGNKETKHCKGIHCTRWTTHSTRPAERFTSLFPDDAAVSNEMWHRPTCEITSENSFTINMEATRLSYIQIHVQGARRAPHVQELRLHGEGLNADPFWVGVEAQPGPVLPYSFHNLAVVLLGNISVIMKHYHASVALKQTCGTQRGDKRTRRWNKWHESRLACHKRRSLFCHGKGRDAGRSLSEENSRRGAGDNADTNTAADVE